MLETGKVTRVGGNEPITVDVRVIAATNRKPEEAVAKGKLREDLLYRLNVFPIQLPPLRDRARGRRAARRALPGPAQQGARHDEGLHAARARTGCAATTGRATCAS